MLCPPGRRLTQVTVVSAVGGAEDVGEAIELLRAALPLEDSRRPRLLVLIAQLRAGGCGVAQGTELDLTQELAMVSAAFSSLRIRASSSSTSSALPHAEGAHRTAAAGRGSEEGAVGRERGRLRPLTLSARSSRSLASMTALGLGRRRLRIHHFAQPLFGFGLSQPLLAAALSNRPDPAVGPALAAVPMPEPPSLALWRW
jgi:hypothetical protein